MSKTDLSAMKIVTLVNEEAITIGEDFRWKKA
jgi:hypothetical protein